MAGGDDDDVASAILLLASPHIPITLKRAIIKCFPGPSLSRQIVSLVGRVLTGEVGISDAARRRLSRQRLRIHRLARLSPTGTTIRSSLTTKANLELLSALLTAAIPSLGLTGGATAADDPDPTPA